MFSPPMARFPKLSSVLFSIGKLVWAFVTKRKYSGKEMKKELTRVGILSWKLHGSILVNASRMMV